jgi:prophage regulatory protein
MPKTATLTVTINDHDHPSPFPRDELTEAQKRLVVLIAKTAVAEYIAATSATPKDTSIDRILRLPEVTRVTGLCRSTIYQHMQEGRFPKSLSLGARSVGWKESQITAWFDERMAGCQAGERFDTVMNSLYSAIACKAGVDSPSTIKPPVKGRLYAFPR